MGDTLLERAGRALHRDLARQRVRESYELTLRLLDDDALEFVERVAAALVDAYRAGGKVLVFGNGGSAADAQHVAAELLGRYQLERPPLPALALGDSTASLTAIGNDYSFDDVFARQVEALGAPGDVAIGLSTSGTSENVLRGLAAAERRGLVTVGLTGARGTPLRDVARHCLSVPSSDTARVQESHMLLAHILCELVEQELFAGR